MKRATWWMGWLAAAAMAGSAAADEITLEQAETAVGNWIARGGAFGKLAGQAEVAGETFEDPDTGAKMHVVRVPGKGFAVTSADDGIEPIILFSDGDGEFIPEEGNPVWDLLRWDLAARSKALAIEPRSHATPRALTEMSTDPRELNSPQAKWARFLSSPQKTQRDGAVSRGNGIAMEKLSDIRRQPFMKLCWSQMQNSHSMYAYNRFEPRYERPKGSSLSRALKESGQSSAGSGGGNGNEDGDQGFGDWPCGCVATAGGMIMRFLKWPAAAVELASGTWTVLGKSEEERMFGGPYLWDEMGEEEPLEPAQCINVSKLTHDIGVACGADFVNMGSQNKRNLQTGIVAKDFVFSLESVFGYANANWCAFPSDDQVQKGIMTCMDAKLPVLLSIESHSVVVDGCGSDSGEFAIHVNFGWGDRDCNKYWYKPPSLHPNGEDWYTSDLITGMGYNIFTNGTGSILSGRVTGSHAKPCWGAKIWLFSEKGALLGTTNSAPDGIYSFRQAPGKYTVVCSIDNDSRVQETIELEACAYYWYLDRGSVGNILQDFSLPSVPTVASIMAKLLDVDQDQRKGYGANPTEFSSPLTIALSSETPGVEIRYTLDGSQPTSDSALYDGPLTIQDTTTLRAVGYAEGMECSEEFTRTWTFVDVQSRDNFSDARPIVGFSGQSSFDNTGYTKEPGEPLHSSEGHPGGTSAWAVWTAPESGDWTFYLSGIGAKTSRAMDTQLAVYTGNTVSNLTLVASNEDANRCEEDYSSRVSFHAEKGEVYHIAMDSYNGATYPGTLLLRWKEGYVAYVQSAYDTQWLPVSGGTFDMEIDASSNWQVEECPDWITPVNTSGKPGDFLVYNVSPNHTGDERWGVVTLQSGNAPRAFFQLVQHSDLDFVTTKEAALDAAWRNNKRILLVYGRESCIYTQATFLWDMSDLQEEIDAGFVLWYSNCDRQTDADEYVGGGGSLPIVRILDPLDMTKAVATAWRSAVLEGNTTWPGLPVARIELESVSATSATIRTKVREWGLGATAATVTLETACDAAFSSGMSTRKLGTVTEIWTEQAWTFGPPSATEAAFCRLRVTSGDWSEVSDVVEFIPLGIALDNTNLTFASEGEVPWLGQTALSHDGADAARCAINVAAGTNRWVESRLKATVQGPGRLSFWWKGDGAYGWLRLCVDGQAQQDIPVTNRVWKKVSWDFPNPSEHEVEWVLRRYNSDSEYYNVTGWVDQVTWAPEETVPLATALDNDTLAFTSEGEVPWLGQTALSHDGADAARCAMNVAAGTNRWVESRLKTTVQGPGRLSFWWKGDGAYGQLNLCVDGQEKQSSSVTNRVWREVSWDCPNPSEHEVEWVLQRYNSASDYYNATGWVDQVTWTPEEMVPLATALDNDTLAFTSEGEVPWLGQTAVSHDGVDAARCANPATNKQATAYSWLKTEVKGPGRLSFWWKADGNYGTLSFVSDDGVRKSISATNRTWEEESWDFADTNRHEAAWSLSRYNSSYYSMTGWVDQVTWTPGNIVTLDRQNGYSYHPTVLAIRGEAMPAVEPPTRTGYTFGGYYSGTNGTGTRYYTATGASARTWNRSGNATLYAKWTPKTYTVALDRQEGTGGTESVQATFWEIPPAVEIPVRTGFDFTGYFSGQGGTGEQYYNAAGAGVRAWNRASNATLYANWEEKADVKWGYRIENGKAIVTNATPARGKLSMPAELGGCPVEAIGFDAFSRATNLLEMAISENVKNIGASAFDGCTGLLAVTLPAGVTNIGPSAFEWCTGLTTVKLPGSVAGIGEYAFYGCSGLASVVIPDSVAHCGDSAFAYCGSLARLEVPGAWWGTDNVAKSRVPAGCEVVYRGIQPLAVTTAALPEGLEGGAYEASLSATGGVAPYTWHEGAGDYTETGAAGSHAATGTARGWKAVDACWDFSLPFAFPFFGHTYTNAKINSNGALSFGKEAFTAYAYSESTFKASPIIAVLWKDLTTAGGDIYTETGSDWARVRWKGAYYSGGEVNCSATLRKNGTIELSYGAGNAYGGAIGISAGDGAAWMLSEKSGSGSMANAGDIVFRPKDGMPRWLELTAGGVLRGTSAEAGEYAFTVAVEDSAGVVARRSLALSVRSLVSQRVAFDANGGTCGTATREYEIGGRYGSLPTATRENQTFVGWFTEKTGGAQVTTNTTVAKVAVLTLWAHWAAPNLAACKPAGWPAEIFLSAEEGGTAATTNVWTGETVYLNFAYTNAGNAVAGAHRVVGAAKDAKGAEAANWSWSLSRLGTNAACRRMTNIALSVATTGTYVVAVTLDSGGAVAESNESDNEMRLSFSVSDKQTVTFNANGGTCATTSRFYAVGRAYGELPEATKKGHSCIGWFTSATGGVQVTEASSVSQAAARTLWAHWKANAYQVALDMRGGTGGTTNVAVTYGKTMPAITAPTRTGYAFGGYFTGLDGGGVQYYTASGASARKWNRDSDSTLYAQWTPYTYEVSLDAGEGTGGTASVTATFGEALPAIEIPAREEWVFAGYFGGADGTGTQYYSAAGEGVAPWTTAAGGTLFAKWAPESAPLTVWRFYSKAYKGHFFTISEEEKQTLIDTNPNWKFEGGAYRAYTNEAAGTTALYRFYSKNYRGHFFTIDEEEMETVRDTNPNWKYEGIAYYVYPEEAVGTVPVYRFWSKGYRHHFYTIDEEEKDTLIATNPNWKYEGVAFYALALEEAAGARAHERAVNSEKRKVKSGMGEGVVIVTTSDGTDGSAVADGDEGTGWSPEKAGPGWLVLSLEEPVEVAAVEVVGDELPAEWRALLSEDAEAWREEMPCWARYVWVAWPEGAPVLREVHLVEP